MTANPYSSEASTASRCPAGCVPPAFAPATQANQCSDVLEVYHEKGVCFMCSVDAVKATASMPALEQLALPLDEDAIPARALPEQVGRGTQRI